MKINIPISLKLIIANIVYVIPIGVMMYIIISGYQTSIDFAEKERAGNELEQQLIYLVKNVANIYTVDHSTKKEWIDKINVSYEELKSVYVKLESSLKLSEKEMGLKKKEAAYIERVGQVLGTLNLLDDSSSQRYDEVNSVLDKMVDLILYAGDTSNLILDPDLDSYYAMDISLLVMPDLIRTLFSLNSKFVASEPLEPEWLVLQTDKLKNGLINRLENDLNILVEEDENFNGILPSIKSRFEPSVRVVIKNGRKLISKLETMKARGDDSKLRAEFSSMGTGYLKDVIELGSLSISTLDGLLENRILELEKSRSKSVAYSIIVCLIAALISTLMGLSIKQSLVVTITDVLMKLSETLNAINSSARKMETSSSGLAKNMTEQASAVEETVASSEEMAAMLKQTAFHAKQGLEISEKTILESERTKKLTRLLEDSMENIAESSNKLMKIEAIISQIQSKTKIINDIVNETRLLSFNASIEAARAGANGKGFAVVSSEIGKLANISGASADEINKLLEESVIEVRSVISEIDENVKYGVEAFKTTDDSIQNFFSVINKIADSVKAISTATIEQEVGIKQTNKAMNGMDRISKSTSLNSVVLSEEAMTMGQQINVLNSVVKDLEMVIEKSSQEDSSRKFA